MTINARVTDLYYWLWGGKSDRLIPVCVHLNQDVKTFDTSSTELLDRKRNLKKAVMFHLVRGEVGPDEIFKNMGLG